MANSTKESEMNTAEFKDSPLGPIPQDWEVKRLGDVWVRFSTGPFGSALHASDYVEDGTPVVNPMHILDGKIVPSKDMRINDETLNRLSSYRLRKNDIILGRRGEMGRAALVTAKEDGWLCGTGSFSITLDNSVSPDYIALYIRTPNCITAMENGAIGTTIPNLNQAIVSNIPIALPPLPEQQSISEALGEVDELIESLDEQVEKKRLIAKGVAHDLLSAKQRLPGFKGAWEMLKLGDMGIWLKGQALSKSDVTSTGTYECIHYGELFTKYGPVIQTVVSRTDKEPTISSVSGDILFPSSDVTPEGLGRCSAIMADGVVLGGDMIILRLGVTCSPQLVSHVINQNRRMIIAKVTGITVRHITSKALSNIEIPLPPTFAEQQAIADLLSEQDAAIAALEAKREKYARIKEGMMRDLLTGKVRMKGE